MSFESNPPDDMRLQIQKRVETGNKSDWIIVMMYYPFPNTMQIQANGETISSNQINNRIYIFIALLN